MNKLEINHAMEKKTSTEMRLVRTDASFIFFLFSSLPFIIKRFIYDLKWTESEAPITDSTGQIRARHALIYLFIYPFICFSTKKFLF